jgi:uncharacterized membrane-anchored protein
MKPDPDNFRRVWIAFFATSTFAATLGFFSADIGHGDLMLGVAVALEVLVVVGCLSGYARRVQRRLDREREDAQQRQEPLP